MNFQPVWGAGKTEILRRCRRHAHKFLLKKYLFYRARRTHLTAAQNIKFTDRIACFEFNPMIYWIRLQMLLIRWRTRAFSTKLHKFIKWKGQVNRPTVCPSVRCNPNNVLNLENTLNLSDIHETNINPMCRVATAAAAAINVITDIVRSWRQKSRKKKLRARSHAPLSKEIETFMCEQRTNCDKSQNSKAKNSHRFASHSIGHPRIVLVHMANHATIF